MKNNKTKIDELIEKQNQAELREKKELENLKISAKEVFKSAEGKHILRFLKKACHWDEQDMNINNEVLIYKKGRRDIWLIIRNLLPKDVLAQIEIYDTENITE